MTKKTKITIAVSIGIIILTAGAIFAIQFWEKRKKSSAAKQMQMPEDNVSASISVKTYEAAITELNSYVITNGEIKPQSAVEVFPSMNGKIAVSNVLLGSYVKKGDIIAKIDPSEPGANYSLNPVTAPISGTIVSTPLKAGTKVSTSTAVTIIGDIDNLQISANIPERYVAELKTGLKAEIFLEAYPDSVFEAFVSRVSPVVDAASRTKQIILSFYSKDSRINAGMFARIKLYTSKYSGFNVVPANAVSRHNGVPYLFVVNDDNTVSKREVQTAKEVDGLIQITDNLMSGERVVYEGLLTLFDGAKVKDITNGIPAEQPEEESGKTGEEK